MNETEFGTLVRNLRAPLVPGEAIPEQLVVRSQTVERKWSNGKVDWVREPVTCNACGQNAWDGSGGVWTCWNCEGMK
jgi:hypothetical protein